MKAKSKKSIVKSLLEKSQKKRDARAKEKDEILDRLKTKPKLPRRVLGTKKEEPKPEPVNHAAIEERKAQEREKAYLSELEKLKLPELKDRAEKRGIKTAEKKKSELIKEIHGVESKL